MRSRCRLSSSGVFSRSPIRSKNIKDLFAKPDFQARGLSRLTDAQSIMLELSKKLKGEEKKQLDRAISLIVSAQTDLLGDALLDDEHTEPEIDKKMKMSEYDISAMEHAMAYAAMPSGLSKYWYGQYDNSRAASPPSQTTIARERGRSMSHTTQDLKTASGTRPTKRRGSHIERILAQTSVNMRITETPTPNVERILSKVDMWDEFDIWALNEEVGGKCLSLLAYHLMDRYDIFSKLQISRHHLVNYLNEIETGYNDVPYHNHIHAADVLHATHFFLSTPMLKKLCSQFPLMRLSAYLAAGVHDFKHPGTNNDFAKKTKSDVSLLYNDVSVLENMHVSEAFRVLNKKNCDFLNSLGELDYKTLRKLVVSMVLHTDMAKHHGSIRQLKKTLAFKAQTQSGWLERKDSEGWLSEVSMLLDLCVHCADLSGPCRPWPLMHKWTSRVLEEFWTQGDMEKDHGLSVGPGNDRAKAKDMPLGQCFFIEAFVKPLWIEWGKVVPETKVCFANLKSNLEFWRQEAEKRKKEKAEAAKSQPASAAPAAAEAKSTSPPIGQVNRLLSHTSTAQ
uniref:Phosphodiesterase n=1 Tax=Lotharella globosa TaxID=91324 RepID=A0A7S3YUK2_9EUKA